MEKITGPKIILITDMLNPHIKWAYTSIKACLNHLENPLDVSQRRWSQIIKDNKEKYEGNGYPFMHSGCKVEMFHAYNQHDVKNDNPPIIEE